MRRPSVLVPVAVLVMIVAGCGPRQRDVERYLDRGRYGRALRVARRADDPGLRLANETIVAERLLAALEGEVRITADPSATVTASLGSIPPVYAAGRALPLRVEVYVVRSERVPMSFRVLGLSHRGTRFLRTAECPPPEAVDLDCVEWLAGAPITPACETSRPGPGDRAAADVVRWMSGGLVNVPPPRQEAPVCRREPVDIPATHRPGLELAARRLAEALAIATPRVSAGGRYERSELLYESNDPGEGNALWLQVSLHVDRRAAPLRYTARIPLPDGETAASGVAVAFERSLPLSGIFRTMTPAGARGR